MNVIECEFKKNCYSHSILHRFKIFALQLRGNQKDFIFQLHHPFSKFEVPVFVILKHIFELFGLYIICFLIQKLLELIRLSFNIQFWRKSQNNKGGKFELRSQLCYCIKEFLRSIKISFGKSTNLIRLAGKFILSTIISLDFRMTFNFRVGSKKNR